MEWEKIIPENKSKEFKDKISELIQIINKTDIEGFGLFGGGAKSILYFFYSKVFQIENYSDLALESISSIFEEIQKGFSYHTFAGGLAGIGWMVEFLEQNKYLECNTNEIIGELDEYLYQMMIKELKSVHYDYLHGASGIALYFLSRKSFSKSKQYLSDYIDNLEQFAEADGESYRWVSKVFKSPEEKEEVYNLSLSHGISSLISILSKINSLEINKEKTNKLLKGAVNYLLSNEQDNKQYGSYFPNWISKQSSNGTSRLAWCYGDLGICTALWHASQSLKNKAWEEKAIEILKYTSKRRDLAKNSVADAGLCHGTAGMAHIFNRMYHYTNVEELKDAANYWFDKTLKMATHKDTLSGYKVYRTKEAGESYEEFGFLEGISGIALSLIAAISETEPKWDEILLLS